LGILCPVRRLRKNEFVTSAVSSATAAALRWPLDANFPAFGRRDAPQTDHETKGSPERVPGLQGHEETSRGELLDSPTISRAQGCAKGNVNTGTFQVYNIANNHLTGSAPLGAVGVEWQLGGVAPTISLPPDFTQPEGLAGSTSQLVQAMAGFGGGAADTSNTVTLGADTSQQTFLTTPQHA